MGSLYRLGPRSDHGGCDDESDLVWEVRLGCAAFVAVMESTDFGQLYDLTHRWRSPV